MGPSQLIIDRLASLLSTDQTTIAPPANALKVHLAQNDFAESPALLLADLIEADFTGATALNAGVGDCDIGLDPLTNEWRILINEPAGGWDWTTTNTANLPQTIFGFYVTNQANNALYGAKRFDNPVELTAVNQMVSVGEVDFRLVLVPLS